MPDIGKDGKVKAVGGINYRYAPRLKKYLADVRGLVASHRMAEAQGRLNGRDKVDRDRRVKDWMLEDADAIRDAAEDGSTAPFDPNRLTDIDPETAATLYRFYFHDVYQGHPEGGRAVERIGESDMFAAVLDIQFRAGGGAGTRMVQDAINAANFDKSTTVDGNPGSRTLEALRKIAQDPEKKVRFLDNLSALREKAYQGEARNKLF